MTDLNIFPHRGKLLASALLALVILFLVSQHPASRKAFASGYVSDWVDRISASSARMPSASSNGRQLPNCRVADLLDDDTVRKYGSNAVKLSRGYEGTGTLVKRVLERARAGQPIRLAAIGGSVSFGHALAQPLSADNHMYYRVLEWFKREFPNADHTLDLSGALPAVSNIYLGYCATEHLKTEEVDLVFVEMDVNSLPLTEADSLIGTETVYRMLRDLPSQPAIISASALGLIHNDLSTGWINTLASTQWFDIPLISLRNWLVPQLVLHPERTALWYTNFAGDYDGRHMNRRGHIAMGDMLTLYLREQLCEVDRARSFPDLVAAAVEPLDEAIPRTEINDHTLALGLQERFTGKAIERGPIQPKCRGVLSKTNPLVPVKNEGWQTVTRNDKVAWEAEAPGSSISFEVSTVLGEVGLWIWQTEDAEYGWAQCTVDVSDGTTRGPATAWGWHPVGMRPVSLFGCAAVIRVWRVAEIILSWSREMASDLPIGTHLLTCRNERAPEAPDNSGARFRIFAMLSR